MSCCNHLEREKHCQRKEHEWQRLSFVEFSRFCMIPVTTTVCTYSIMQTTGEALPHTSDEVQLDIQRANYQTFIWKQVDVPFPAMPSLALSGWKNCDGKLKPILTTLPPVPKACREIVFCRCTKGCTSKNCSCKKAGNLPCSAACKCSDGPVPYTNRK